MTPLTGMDGRGVVAPVRQTPRTPADRTGVRFDTGLWADRLTVNRERSIPHGFRMLESSGALANLRHAARGDGRYVGGLDDAGITFPFLDSDVYKWLEATGWELGRAPDARLQGMADTAIGTVAAAQADDGYLDSWGRLSGRPRWSDLQWGHELYCMGHLIQAAVAWRRAVGDDRLLDVAVRAADCIEAAFGPDGAVQGVDGHPEIEMALVELYRTTGAERHLALARLLLERRGHGVLGPDRFGSRYWQDHLPVREAPTVAGHAVRQLYLECGAVDVAVETDDHELLAAVRRRWQEMRSTRSYITGGVGARHRDESFGDPWELPPDRAYTETCAAIASVMLAWRLLLATGDETYADAIEGTLLNGVLSGVARDGTGFFYVNPLQRRAADGSAAPAGRQPWYPCACCPPNLMRTFSSVEQLVATTDASGIRLHQYAGCTVDAGADGSAVSLRVTTDYPWAGRVTVEVVRTPPEPWALGLRVPAWAGSATLSIGEAIVDARSRPGGLTVQRAWQAGDRVILELPMQPRFTTPDARIDAVRGCVAVERGPIVYCVEDADLPAGVVVADVEADTSADLVDAPGDGMSGRVGIELTMWHRPRAVAAWPYAPFPGSADEASGRPFRTRIGPYHDWAERGSGAMRVWMPAACGADGAVPGSGSIDAGAHV
jgi:DUF1680 family protein